MSSTFSRRELLKFALTAPLLAGVPQLAADISKTEISLPIPHLPNVFAGYRIAYVSDLHLGVWVTKDFIANAFDIIRASDVDLVLLGGDYVGIVDDIARLTYSWKIDRTLDAPTPDEQVDKSFLALSRLLKTLQPKDGVFGVFGNHDRWWGPRQCIKAFADAKCTLLVNQAATIKRSNAHLELVGIDDMWTGLPRYPANLKPHLTRIVLSHNPDYVAKLLERPQVKFNLALSGHTHGGQIVLPGLGAMFYNVENTHLASGMYVSEKGPTVYTSRGIGVVKVPYRFHCSPEVTVFTLKQA